MDERRFKKRTLFLIAYLVFAILPVYWMINMSFKTNEEILSTFSLVYFLIIQVVSYVLFTVINRSSNPSAPKEVQA